MNVAFASTHERSYAGCIVTLVNTDTGEERVRHAPGYSYSTGSRRWGNEARHTFTLERALTRLLDEVEGWDGTWKVRTISTPTTILADLKGRHSGPHGARPTSPEANILSQIGRVDMWEGRHAKRQVRR